MRNRQKQPSSIYIGQIGYGLARRPRRKSQGVAIDLSTLSYQGVNYDYSAIAGRFREGHFSPDGTKFIAVQDSSNRVESFTLSTPWDFSTISYDGLGKSYTPTEESNLKSFSMNDDGTRMYLSGFTNGTIWQYDLATAWAPSSATYNGGFLDTTAYANYYAHFWGDSGSKLYVVNINIIYEYDVSTPYDLSTATANGNSLTMTYNSGIDGGPMYFTNDGKTLIQTFLTADVIGRFTLGTAWDITTATQEADILNYSGQDTHAGTVWMNPEGTKLYITGGTTDFFYEYS